MLTIHCSGTPYSIGHTHGTYAKPQIHSSLAFYTAFFHETASLSYSAASQTALRFLPYLTQSHPDLLSELHGVADGAGVPFEQILALNVRTEISYGLATAAGQVGPGHGVGATDGCTALSYHAPGTAILAQNWDWREPQRGNLIRLVVKQSGGSTDGNAGTTSGSGDGISSSRSPPKADLAIITEAGIIGKIGLNSRGLGVCLNAIRAPGVAYDKLPVHLALRVALDTAGSLSDVVSALEREGVASSAHILVAGPEGAVGLETGVGGVVRVGERRVEGDGDGDGDGREGREDGEAREAREARVVVHTNHYVEGHGVGDGGGFLEDSLGRLKRVGELVGGKEGEVGVEDVKGWLRDEEGFPGSICRQRRGGDSTMTLFSVVMDLKAGVGYVKMGRPTEGGEEVELRPGEL